MSKHTPGPWRTAIRRGFIAVFAGPQNTAVVVADCRSVDTESTEQIANCRLIAAAPELLEALQECLAIVAIQNGNLHSDTNAIQDKARAAIAKAKGDQ